MTTTPSTVFVRAALALLLTVGSTGTVRAADPAFGTNLVVNGDAEADVGSSSDSPVVKPTGWTTTGNFTVVQYGASGGFPTLTSPGPDDRGKNFFAGGVGPKGGATQTIKLDWASKEIAGRAVHYAFSAYLGGFETQRDYATVSVSFRSANGATLGSAVLGPVTHVDRKSVSGLLRRSLEGDVPKGSASAVVTITSTRFDGVYNDGEADNVSLILTK
jgi:hypothetical protein